MVKIKAAKFFNCQSWADSVLEFAPGLNVIRARNNTGKSVVFKMIKITCNPKYYSREEREKLIRYNADYAEVSFIFDDNSACMTRVFPNSVIYFFTPDLNSVPLSQKVGEPHDEILDRLSVVIEKESGFMANIIDLEQDLLLVNSESKANLNLVKILTEHEELNRLTAMLFDKLVGLKEGLDRVTIKREQCKYRLEGYKYTDTSDMKSRYEVLQALTPVVKSMKSLNDCMVGCSKSLSDTDRIKSFSKLLNFAIDLSDISNVKVVDCEYTRDDVNTISTAIDVIPVINLVNDVEVIDNKVDYLSGILDVLAVCELVNEQHRIQVDLDKLNKAKLLLDICGVFNETDIKYYMKCNESINVLNSDITNMRGLLEELGEKVSCPIHGSITYVEGECVPVF